MKKNNTPEIRFPGFTGDWEQRRLGEFVEDYIEKTTIQNQYPVLTSSQQRGIILQEEYFANRQVTTDNNVGYFVLPKGYFTYRSRSDNNIFVFNRNDLIEKGIISYFYPVFNIINTDSEFFLRRINNGIERQVATAAEGTGQHVLSIEKFKNIVTLFPRIEEQTKIGEFLKQLDDTITLHQQELTILKITKQGFLRKMFPKKGESVPKVRFPGFTGEWEQHEFGDIYDIVSGFAFNVSDYVQVGVPIINGESIQHGSISTKNLNFLSKEFSEKYQNFILKTGDIVLGLNRPITNGNLKIAQVPMDFHGALLYQRAGKIIILNNSDINFTYQLLGNEVSKFVLKEAVGSDQPFISTTKLKKWSIRIPTLEEEQLKIGHFLMSFDETIALHQRELDALKETKKAFLQKMFV